jgi:hypothetical protein
LLALSLGMTHRELCSRMTWDEFEKWGELYRSDPWGRHRDDVRTALAASAVCASMGAKVTPHQLIPKWGEREHGLNREELLAWVANYNTLRGYAQQ